MISHGTTQDGKQDAISNVQKDIDDVKGIMTENIERVLERGERIDLLVDKTDRLGIGAHDFRVRSRGLKRQMWWKNVKLMVLLGVVVVFLVYLFVGFGCGLPGTFHVLFSSVLPLHSLGVMRKRCDILSCGSRLLQRMPFSLCGGSLFYNFYLVSKLTVIAAWSRCTGN